MVRLDNKAFWYLFWQHLMWAFGFLCLTLVVFIFPIIKLSTKYSNYVSIFFLIICVIIVVFNYLLTLLYWRSYSYELRDTVFYQESGLIGKKFVSIPYERIQTIEIQQTVIGRLFGYVNVQIQTAGATDIEGHIPAIKYEHSLVLKNELIKKVQR